MTEFLKKSILFAIGAAAIIREKSEELLRLVIAKGQAETEKKDKKDCDSPE